MRCEVSIQGRQLPWMETSESEAVHTLRADAVSVNPETERDVRLNHQVDDSTTADILVSVSTTVDEKNINNTSQRVDGDRLNSGRGTGLNVEHSE